ncbi:MAG: hypothetical protein JST64_05985 [Actinobacteria bacterium]|nr:hypothetical protein [Actinomycetota bacterium]
MNDLIVLGLTVAFFAASVAYVGLCDRILGPDPTARTDATVAASEDRSGGLADDQAAAGSVTS